MRVAIVGGKLQGVEAIYLAHKAGWDVLLVDRKENVPASGLCDHFVLQDVTDIQAFNTHLDNIDIVIPTTENQEALESLVEWSRTSSIPLAFDPQAYAISSSKLKSDTLFAEIGVPVPKHWPSCTFPIICKPSEGSGSEGVYYFQTQEQLQSVFPPPYPRPNWVFQEYLEGPSYSLEVVGTPGNYKTIQVTDLEMDHQYDCKRVTAPTTLTPQLEKEFRRISLHIAETIQLKGLMDVEVILHQGQLKVLEIDARFPSQTPTAVYQSTGINLLELLVQCYHHNKKNSTHTPTNIETHTHTPITTPNPSSVIYEHIKILPNTIEVCGEHIMRDAEPLILHEIFLETGEAIIGRIPQTDQWVSTLIVSGHTTQETWEKRNNIIEKIKNLAIDWGKGRTKKQ